jgi:hypothetical protein
MKLGASSDFIRQRGDILSLDDHNLTPVQNGAELYLPLDLTNVSCLWLDLSVGNHLCVQHTGFPPFSPLILYYLMELFSPQITIRSADPDLIWHHIINSGVTHYCAAPTVQVESRPSVRALDR